MPTTTITSKGQVTIPKAVRERLGLQVGDVLDTRVTDEGNVVLSPRSGSVLERVSGLLKDFAPATPVTVEDMKRAVRQRAAEKYARPSS